MTNDILVSLAADANKAYQVGDYEEAAKLFENASKMYAEAGDAVNAAEMANNRSVALLQNGNTQEALEAAQGTEQVFAQAGDTRRQAMAIGNQAAALEAMGRNDEALTRYWECSDLLKQIGEKEYRAIVLKSISALQVRTGHHVEALASMEAALENQNKLSLQDRLLKGLLQVPLRMMKRGK